MGRKCKHGITASHKCCSVLDMVKKESRKMLAMNNEELWKSQVVDGGDLTEGEMAKYRDKPFVVEFESYDGKCG